MTLSCCSCSVVVRVVVVVVLSSPVSEQEPNKSLVVATKSLQLAFNGF